MFVRIFFLLFILTLGITGGLAQENKAPFSHWLKTKEGFRIEPFLMLQMWALHSQGQELYDPVSKSYVPVDDRLNFQLRRARFGFRAQPFEDIRFTFMGSYDLVGRDALTGTQGGTNNGSLPEFGLWDAFLEWRLIPKSEKLFLVAGYFRPQFSRESITGAWAVPSIEKSMSQNYLRKQLTGNGPGRTIGVNLGGMWWDEDARIGLNYNIGVFTPQYLSFGTLSSGKQSAPLLAGRAVLELGDAESKNYKINYDLNFYDRRKGISFAVAAAYQGETDIFSSNYGLQGDVLWNAGPLNFDAEYNRLWREGMQNGPGSKFKAAYSTGHIRGSYNLKLRNKYFLEPAAMVMFFDGAMDEQGQKDAAALKLSSGKERAYDLGLNWHLQERKLKLLLHYTWRTGDAGAAGDGAQVNAFFSEPGIGAIRRGNWLGLGVHAIF